MGIVKLVQPPAHHTCAPPPNPEETYGLGTVWACEVCGKQAQLAYDQRDGFTWQWLLNKDYIK